jgi:hypothetical protein
MHRKQCHLTDKLQVLMKLPQLTLLFLVEAKNNAIIHAIDNDSMLPTLTIIRPCIVLTLGSTSA